MRNKKDAGPGQVNNMPSISLPLDDERADLLWHCVDNEDDEKREDGDNNQSNDILLVFLPDEEDEGLHRVDEPGEAGGGTTGETTEDSLCVHTWAVEAYRPHQIQNISVLPQNKLSLLVTRNDRITKLVHQRNRSG